MSHRARLVCAFAIGCVLSAPAILLADRAAGQVRTTEPEPELPALPRGSASLKGVVRLPDGASVGPGVPIVLYALDAEGRPGVRSSETDARGEFRFESLSNDPETGYLVGARYREVPFGSRVVFEPGRDLAEVAIEVSEVSDDTSSIRVLESIYRADWRGAGLRIEVTQRLHNDGEEVVYIPASGRNKGTPAFQAVLPREAQAISPAENAVGDGLQVEANQLRYWGPVYPGEQEIGYRYDLALTSRELALDERLPSGTARAVVLAPRGALELGSTRFSPGEDVEIEGSTYQSLETSDLAPGATFDVRFSVPESRNDSGALSLKRGSLWLELDDTGLAVTLELALEVEGTTRLAGSEDAPLLEISLPPQAELLGISQQAREAGTIASTGGVSLLGPVSPGESQIAVRYRLAPDSADGSAVLAPQFPLLVPTLDFLIADTGVSIESDRLHRLRPMRAGTRTYLRRQAFAVEPGESLSLRITPTRRRTLSRSASLGFAALSLLGAAGFLFAPLRPRAQSAEPDRIESSRERDVLYQNIRDLDHDFETGKLEDADYHEMRAELRGRAVDALRRERDTRAEPAPVPEKRFCTDCGEKSEPSWRFCSRCGAELPRPETHG